MEITFRVAGLEEIRQWVMSMGTEARVLGPENLRGLVKAELEGALTYYTEPIESLHEQLTLFEKTDFAS